MPLYNYWCLVDSKYSFEQRNSVLLIGIMNAVYKYNIAII